MVISTFNEGWEERLVRLRRCVAEQPDGPVWLWGIRIRILVFLASRHQRDDQSLALAMREHAAPATVDGPHDDDRTSEDALGPAAPWHAAPLAASDYPPRMRHTINPVLERLQVVNDANRMRIDRGAQPQDVWLWWREEWCHGSSHSLAHRAG